MNLSSLIAIAHLLLNSVGVQTVGQWFQFAMKIGVISSRRSRAKDCSGEGNIRMRYKGMPGKA